MLLNEFLEKSAELYPNKIALVFQDQRLTFTQIDNAANSLSNALIDEGFRRQDKAAVYLDNSTESVVSLFGILKAGGVFVIVDPQVKARKLEYILSDCQARVLITDTKYLKQISEVVVNSLSLSHVIVTDYEKTSTINELISGCRILSYRTILEGYSPIPTIP
jgi:acyl-CoA synthetase (AMP-forming)/AMP-acid ligase II